MAADDVLIWNEVHTITSGRDDNHICKGVVCQFVVQKHSALDIVEWEVPDSNVPVLRVDPVCSCLYEVMKVLQARDDYSQIQWMIIFGMGSFRYP